MSLYVYAVGRAGEDDLPAVRGVFDYPAYRFEVEPLSAVISQCPSETVRAERRHIAATQNVLAALNAKFDLLPMAFGTVTESEGDLRRFLNDNREVLTAQLHRVSGAVEMSLRLSFEVADPIAYLVERTPALQAAREHLFRGRRAPSYDAKIRLGQLVDATLRDYREAHTAHVIGVIGPCCAEVITLPVRVEMEIANVAALVPRSALDQFEGAVHAVAAEVDEDIAFCIGGPWPPHTFVQFDPGRA